MALFKLHWKLLLMVSLIGCNLTTATTPTAAPLPPTLPAAPPLTEDAAPVNPNCALTPPGWVEYTVEPGDSMGLLADQTSSTIEELVAGNCLDNADQIFVGQVLYLPQQPVV
jgi:LysM repeat protein